MTLHINIQCRLHKHGFGSNSLSPSDIKHLLYSKINALFKNHIHPSIFCAHHFLFKQVYNERDISPD